MSRDRMQPPSAGTAPTVIVDDDRRRAEALAAALASGRALLAASLYDAFALIEERLPGLVLLSAGVARDSGLAMFVQLLDMVGARLLAYGQDPPEGLPRRSGWVTVARGTPPEEVAAAVVAVLRRSALPAVPVAVSGRRSGPDLIAMGASTGGIAAIEAVLAGFGAECPPVLIVQHIRPGFIDSTIARLERVCAPRVTAAGDGLTLARGTVYIAAGTGCHLTLAAGEPLRSALRPAAPEGGGHRPSVDALFDSVARLGPRVSAALLTGMGRDGARGLLRIRQAGGFTVAQDKETCVVHGMPHAAAEIGAACAILPLGAVAPALLAGRSGAGAEVGMGVGRAAPALAGRAP